MRRGEPRAALSSAARRCAGRGALPRPRWNRIRRRSPPARRTGGPHRRASLLAPTGTGGGSRGLGMNVLIVEDEPGAREALVELVKELGYQASAAGSVAEAEAALARITPDVCITDLGLPDGDGLDVVRAAKAAGRDCDVLVLTGKGSVRSAVEAMKAGAHDFLLKPLKTAQLATALSLLSGRHEEARGVLASRAPRSCRGGRPRRNDRPLGPDAGGLPSPHPGGPLQRARDDHRGERVREGGRGRDGAPPVAACGAAVHRPQLRGDLADPRRERALRPRERSVHRSRPAPRRDVRDGPRGDALPGRGDGDAPGPPGEVPARPRDPDLPARGRERGAGHGHPARWRAPTATSPKRSAGRRSGPISSTG